VLERTDTPLAELTTLRLGGPAARLLEAREEAELIAAVGEADAAGRPLLLLAGGSNLVISDDGFPGDVIAIRTRGIQRRERGGDRVQLEVAAGESWDALVATAVADGLAGIECLSGIPGSTGATPIQNVGAYGQEVAETIVAVRAWDREAGTRVELGPADCGFAYRASAFKHSDRHLILSVVFELERSPLAAPIRYPELARAIGVEPGETPPLGGVREAVLGLRRGKGMVVDRADPDSVSAGSFFTNPIFSEREFDALKGRVAVRLGDGVQPPAWPAPEGGLKSSAAWLIERAGFGRGYGEGRAGISSKHTLALVNRGDATTAELLTVAREIRDGVEDAFGVRLRAEPTLVGAEL
jgi:UDP-N-acetylmuramate dehydrogenase